MLDADTLTNPSTRRRLGATVDQPRMRLDPSTNGDYTITLNVNRSEVFGPSTRLRPPQSQVDIGQRLESGSPDGTPRRMPMVVPAVELSA